MKGIRPKKKSGPKRGTYNVTPAEWCGIVKKDGTPCRTRKKSGINTCAMHAGVDRDVEALIPGQHYDLPPEMDVFDIPSLLLALIDTMNRVRTGKLKSPIGNSVAIQAREIARLFIAQEKLSPDKIAKRAFSREAAQKMAYSITKEEALAYIKSRDASFLLNRPQLEDLPELPRLPQADNKALKLMIDDAKKLDTESAYADDLEEDLND